MEGITWWVQIGTFILQLLLVAGAICASVASYKAFKQVTTNHLQHISNDMQEVKVNQKDTQKDIVTLKEDVAAIKASNNARDARCASHEDLIKRLVDKDK